MTAFLVLTETEPLIVATPWDAVSDGRLVESHSRAGIDRFNARGISVDRLREMYGVPFEVIETDIKNGKDLRVLDSNGRHVLAQIQFSDLGPVFAHGL